MTGLSNVLQAIEEQADERAEKILAEAEQAASQYSEQAYKEAKEKMQKQYGQAELKAAFAYKPAQAAAQKEERDALLWEKAKRIESVFAKALEAARQDERYFAFLQDRIVKNALAEPGVLVMAKEDVARVPKEFMQIMQPRLPQGAALTMEASDTVKSGFILRYADMEQNCTLQAILQEKRNVLLGLVARILSGEGAKQ